MKLELPNVVCDTGADDEDASESSGNVERAGGIAETEATDAGILAEGCEFDIGVFDFEETAGKAGAEAEEEVLGREGGRVVDRLARDLEGPSRASTAADLSKELEGVNVEGFDFRL